MEHQDHKDIFYKTSRMGASGHYHLVFSPTDGSEAKVSVFKGHTHQLLEDGTLSPAGDGHTHIVIGPVEAAQVSKKKDDDLLAGEILEGFLADKDEEKEFRTKGRESDQFVSHDQWKKGDYNKLTHDKKAALTINEIEPKIDVLSGYQRQNRTDIWFRPAEGGDARVAEILNIIVKNILTQNLYEYAETEVFDDQAITGRGLFNVDVDYDKNIEGDIIIERFPWDEGVFGPHNKKDISDLEVQYKAKWYSFNKIKQLWPDKWKDIENARKLRTDSDDEDRHVVDPGNQYTHGKDIGFTPSLFNPMRKEYRVVERWMKEFSRVKILVDVEQDIYVNTEDWSASDIKTAASFPGFSVVEQIVTNMRVTKVAGGVVLEDEFSDLFDAFPMIPVYAKKRGKKVWGKVEGMKDLQRETNKRRSQLSDIINRCDNYGWFIDSGTFDDDTQKRRFKTNVSTPGFVVEIADVEHPPHRVEGIKFPNEIANYEIEASNKLKEISNINEEMGGGGGKYQSALALAEKKRAGLLGNEYLFDNLSLAKVVLGRLVLSLIQKVWTADRILRLLVHEYKMSKKAGVPSDGSPANPLGNMAAEQQPQPEAATPTPEDLQAIKQLLETSDLSKYDVVVSENTNSPTNRAANFAIWAELASQGVQVPPEYLISLSDAPQKDQFLKGMQQAQAAQQAETDRTRQTEIAKTQIAHQEKPQEV